MVRFAWLLVVLVGCKSSMDGDDFPIDPGGGTGGGIKTDAFIAADAADGDALANLAGRVCLIADLRTPTACAATGAGGITVTLGSRAAVTSDSGAFTIQRPPEANLVWRASGAGIVTSVVPFGAVHSIPAIGVGDFEDIANANGVAQQAGQGSVIARVVRNGVTQAGVVATVSPAAAFDTLYDGPSATTWLDNTATGAAGTVWIPGAATGFTTVTLTPASGSAVTEAVRVEDRAITYVTVDLP